MKIVYNKFIPFDGFGLMNILGLVFSRVPVNEVSEKSKCHEQWHTLQQYELLAISAIIALVVCNIYQSWWYLPITIVMPFVIYMLFFLIEVMIPPYHNVGLHFKGKPFGKKIKAVPSFLLDVWIDAYRDNCFEREAFMNEKNPKHIIRRRFCEWIYYTIPTKDRRR